MTTQVFLRATGRPRRAGGDAPPATTADDSGLDVPRLGALLRSVRLAHGLTLLRTAALAETSPSHLSRLERGERGAVSVRLLARLATVLDVDAVELFSAAGLLLPAVEHDLADHRLAYALVENGRLPERTRWMLRRRHLAVLAERAFQAPAAGPVDIIGLVQASGFALTARQGSGRRLELDGTIVRVVAEPLELQRLLLAHFLAHTVLATEPTCVLDSPGYSPEEEDLEAEATALASFILVPTTTLSIAVSDESARYDLWAGETGDLLDALAGRLGAPAWVIARRVGEEALFVEAANLEDM